MKINSNAEYAEENAEGAEIKTSAFSAYFSAFSALKKKNYEKVRTINRSKA